MRYSWLILLVLIGGVLPTAAQVEVPFCGLADSIGYPIDNLVQGYDDFSTYRERFGGRHVGLDTGFERWGEPVMAAARGRVTLSNIEEWDTEKGVVIVAHTFPDGSVAYTLYGHMEESDTVKFPPVGACVEEGEAIGTIGWPSRGKPHLHYEIRNFMPGEGGPGYVTTNPLALGWYNPLDFTELWRVRLTPGFISAATFLSIPALPPVALPNGTYAIASANRIEGTTASGEVLWRVETDGDVIGLAALSGERLVAHTRNGQALTLQNGRYLALWNVPGIDLSFLLLDDETLVFPQIGGGLAAYQPDSTALWSIPPTASTDRLADFKTNGTQIALGVTGEDGETLWRLVDASGTVTYETTFENTPVTAPDWNGSWVGLDGLQIRYFSGGENHTLGALPLVPGRTATMTTDLMGHGYLYLGDFESTLLALDRDGQVRWRTTYPQPPLALPPLMATGNGCLLYTLDIDGTLNVFSTTTGDLVNQMHLYAGGRQNSSPRARFLAVEAGERVHLSSGFLSMVTLDGWALGGEAATNCVLG